MTIAAGVADTLHRSQRAPVTVVAGNIYMGTIQIEARLHVVVEQPQIPRDRVVAGATFNIETALVSIIFSVAVDAVAARAGKNRGFMTRIAFEIVMFPQQRKSGQVVDEIGRFLPAFLSVAIVALVALLAVMNFVLKMAGGAGCAR